MNVQKNEYQENMKNRGRVTMVPNELWELSEIDAIAKVIWCFILSLPPQAPTGRNEIARRLGFDNKTVTHRVNLLVELNMLERYEEQGDWNFKILTPDRWRTASSTSDAEQGTEAPINEGHTPPPEEDA